MCFLCFSRLSFFLLVSYTRSSIVFRWIRNNIDEWNEASEKQDVDRTVRYGRYDPFAAGSPHWISFDGAGIQDAYGQPVLGTPTGAFYVDSANNDRISDRDYALQVEIIPAVACPTLDSNAAGGNGQVVCDAQTCELQCDDGYGSSTPLQTCQSNGAWSAQGLCVSVPPPTVRESRRIGELDPYSFTLTWSPSGASASLPSGIVLLGWEMRSILVRPRATDACYLLCCMSAA